MGWECGEGYRHVPAAVGDLGGELHSLCLPAAQARRGKPWLRAHRAWAGEEGGLRARQVGVGTARTRTDDRWGSLIRAEARDSWKKDRWRLEQLGQGRHGMHEVLEPGGVGLQWRRVPEKVQKGTRGTVEGMIGGWIWGCFPPALFLVVTGATNAISKAYAHEVSQGLACVVGELLLSVCLLSANPIRLRIVCFIWFPQMSSPPGSLPSAPQGGGGCLHWASTDPWCSPIIALIYSFKTYLYTPSTCQASSRCQGYSSEQNRLKKIKRPCHHEAYVEVRADQRK